MDYLHRDLGHLATGTAVAVHLSHRANVHLVDESNLRSYRSGRSFRSVGGHYSQTPVRFSVPQSGRWHVVVDLGGRSGRIGARVEVAA